MRALYGRVEPLALDALERGTNRVSVRSISNKDKQVWSIYLRTLLAGFFVSSDYRHLCG